MSTYVDIYWGYIYLIILYINKGILYKTNENVHNPIHQLLKVPKVNYGRFRKYLDVEVWQ